MIIHKNKLLVMIFFSDANQSQCSSDTETEIVIDKDVCKYVNLENGISGNVKFGNVILLHG